MAIGVVARKALWARAGNACAFPNCRRELMQSTDELTGAALTHAGILIGEEAHIRATSPQGPRHDPDYSDVDSYDNLLLLCPTHHTVIDKNDGADWPTHRVLELKRDHESWVRTTLSKSDTTDIQRDILMAAEVESFENILFTEWPTIYLGLSQAIPNIKADKADRLVEAGRFLLAKDWPTAYPTIRAAADRLQRLISLITAHIHGEFEFDDRTQVLWLDRPEKRLHSWNPETYHALFRETQLNMAASWWLADSLAASLNYWISCVRSDFDPMYRFSEGVLLVREGDPFFGTTWVRREFGEVPPPLPRSLQHLKDTASRRAEELDMDPQSIDMSDLDFARGPLATDSDR